MWSEKSGNSGEVKMCKNAASSTENSQKSLLIGLMVTHYTSTNPRHGLERETENPKGTLKT